MEPCGVGHMWHDDYTEEGAHYSPPAPSMVYEAQAGIDSAPSEPAQEDQEMMGQQMLTRHDRLPQASTALPTGSCAATMVDAALLEASEQHDVSAPAAAVALTAEADLELEREPPLWVESSGAGAVESRMGPEEFETLEVDELPSTATAPWTDEQVPAVVMRTGNEAPSVQRAANGEDLADMAAAHALGGGDMLGSVEEVVHQLREEYHAGATPPFSSPVTPLPGPAETFMPGAAISGSDDEGRVAGAAVDVGPASGPVQDGSRVSDVEQAAGETMELRTAVDLLQARGGLSSGGNGVGPVMDLGAALGLVHGGTGRGGHAKHQEGVVREVDGTAAAVEAAAGNVDGKASDGSVQEAGKEPRAAPAKDVWGQVARSWQSFSNGFLGKSVNKQ